MKIAYLANVRFPSERAHSAQIAHMCQAFIATGFEVTLHARQQIPKSQFSDHLGFEPSFKVVNTFSISPRRWRFIFYLSEFIFVIAFLFKNPTKNFDYFYSRSEWTLFFLMPFVSPKKMVWESHEARWNHPARSIVKRGVKIVAISDAIKEDYVSYGIPTEQIVVAYDGIDESFFEKLESKNEVRKRLNLQADAFIVMYIGGLDEWKGAELLMQASSRLGDTECVIIGGREEEVRTFQTKYPSVQFLGQRPYSELKHNQQAADILVIPNSGKTNLAARYTSPLKLFSYLASGVPVVASDVPSITSVTGNESVLLFSPDSADSLVSTLQACKQRHAERVRIAQELHEVSKKYTWTERAARIKKFLLH